MALPSTIQDNVTGEFASVTEKGTQGSFGLSTQDLKDSGRSQRVIYIDSFQIAATAETLLTASYSTDNAAPTTGTSYNVTAGKTFVMQSISAALHSTTGNTTNVTAILRLRCAVGAAIVSSPIQLILPLLGTAAVNQTGGASVITFPDGWEFDALSGIAVTIACPGYVSTTAAPLLSLTITGYEY